MSQRYTPGPWFTDKEGQAVFTKEGDTSRLIAVCHAGHHPERSANARLIALAPEMAEFITAIQKGTVCRDGSADAELDAIRKSARALLARLDGDK